jgi:O-antigen/teichoic acid export membrane protein
MAVVGFIDVALGVALSAAVVAAMLGSAQQALGGAFLGRGKPQWDSVAEIVAGTILVCGGLMVAITDGGPAMFIGVVAASRTVACATLAGLFSHTLGPVGDIQHASLRHAFTAGLPYMINAAASFVFLRADIILLGVLSGAVAVSVYGSVADPLVTLSATVHVINTAFLPGLASAGSDERPPLARRMLGLDLLIGCILAALVFFGAEPFVATVLNEEDTASAVVLRVLSVAIALRFISNGLATWLTASGHQWRRTAIATFAGVFNVLVNIIAIPLWGYWAAVGTTIVTEALILCLSIAAVRPEWHMSTGGYLGGHPPATAPKGSHLGSD